MLNFFLARIRVNARYNKISVICKFENAVSLVNRVQVGCSDNEGCWSYRRSLDDAGVDDGDCRDSSGELGAVCVVIEEIDCPVIDAVRYFQLGQFTHQRQVSDRIERLRKVVLIDC